MSPAQPVEIARRHLEHPMDAAESEAVRGLVAQAQAHDGGPALSEAFTLSLGPAGEGTSSGVTHLLAQEPDGSLSGYAQVRDGAPGEPPSAELVVAPAVRRQGVGTALLDALPTDARVWSHLPGAPGRDAADFAAARGLRSVRELHVMGRSLVEPPAWPPARVPDAFVVRTFEPGSDDDAWLAVNAAAFAQHPEQGSLTHDDLRERMAQPWFDADGFLLVCPRTTPDQIAAFHWTKVDPPDGAQGEVYVVGVAPEHQGSGLGRVVTVLGLDHLRGQGLLDVVLYVDADNEAAVRTYSRLGFRDQQVHRQFARAATEGRSKPS